MSAPPEIVEKIKKLLRLSRSANQHEAELALARALALAREHDVAVDTLNPDEQAKEKAITHGDSEARQRLSYDKEYALRIVKAFFRVTPVIRDRIESDGRGGYCYVKFATFVGVASDIEVALYVYNFLVHHFAYCWRKNRGRLRNRHAYVDGMFIGIYTQLQKGQPEWVSRAHSLALRTHEDYIAAVIGKTEKHDGREPDSSSATARFRGFVQGQQTNIAPALKSTDEPAHLTLLP
jgi:hypothetical protein